MQRDEPGGPRRPRSAELAGPGDPRASGGDETDKPNPGQDTLRSAGPALLNPDPVSGGKAWA